MKSLLFFAIIVYGLGLFNPSYAGNHNGPSSSEYCSFQQKAFYFINPIPSEIYLNDKLDLSFFANQLIVSQYRFKLEIPNGTETIIDKNLFDWSLWIKNKMAEIKIPRIDRAGGYRLIIEYKTVASEQSLNFIEYFYVRVETHTSATAKNQTVPSPATKNLISRTGGAEAENVPKTMPAISKAENNASSGINKINPRSLTPNTNDGKEKAGANKRLPESSASGIKKNPVQKILTEITNIAIVPSFKYALVKKDLKNIFPSENINNRDSVLFSDTTRIAVIAGTGSDNKNIISDRPGDTIASREVIPMPGVEKDLINATDNYGNSQLHKAILHGDTSFARSLIDKGADLTLINQIGLTPLHLAVLFNNEELVKLMLGKGTEVNIQGNEGYTPLHIAAELNNIEIANALLLKGARNNIKNRQKLTPATIARIQNNSEMLKLISRKGSDTLTKAKSLPAIVTAAAYLPGQNPKINFNLPYDRVLAGKRQSYKLIQYISIPVFALSAAGTYFMRSEANRSFSSYKTAETEDIARHLYDRTMRLDRLVYVSGTVSLVSVYGFIHSTLKKKSITNKMRKTFY